MSQGTCKKLKTHWEEIKANIEVTDVAYFVIRLIILCGGIGWLIFSNISQKTFANVENLFVYFIAYSLFIYIWLFFFPRKKRIIYVFSLFFDLLYTTVLVRMTGGFYSHFFNGFYLVTALYSFKFGPVPGTAIAVISSTLYLASGDFDFNKIHWTDFSVRVAFLFLLALPIGILSQQLRRDKNKIENLNKDLEKYIEELRTVHLKLVQEEKLSALGRMTADIAHEIRNPLTSIGGFARRLDRKLTPGSKEKKYAEIVISEVNRLERILKDVLTFSRESRFVMQYEEINGIINESLQTFIDICNEQKIQVVEKLDTSLPPVLIDRDQVRLAVNNLISNAVAAMPGGGALQIKSFMANLNKVDYVVAEVADTGPGIPDKALDIIFEPFYTTKEIGTGTGLGLPICNKIMNEHNGLIFVESQLGKGSSFKLFFPHQNKENGNRIKCWEFHKCGVEKAEGAVSMRCPAYPDYGRICWAIAGTFCGKRVTGAIAQKLGDCRKCEFYQRVAIRGDL